MCFKPKVKMPPVPKEDPTLKRQVDQAMALERERKSENKQMRFEQRLAELGGIGRRALLSGGRGGIGFRSLFDRVSS